MINNFNKEYSLNYKSGKCEIMIQVSANRGVSNYYSIIFILWENKWIIQPTCPLFILFQKYQVISHDVGNMKIYNPVHEVEANEAHREHYTGVFVDIRRCHTQKLADILKFNYIYCY